MKGVDLINQVNIEIVNIDKLVRHTNELLIANFFYLAVFNHRVDDYVLPQYRSNDNWGPQVIPEGYDFVMGDHRNNSSDSRHWGNVPKKYIIGNVQIRWWPVPTARVF